MKKLRIMLVALLAVIGSKSVYAAEAYAVAAWDSQGANRRFLLTFYYDNNRSTHEATAGDIVFSLNSGNDSPAWIQNAGSYNPNDIKEVIFDASFASYSPTSTSHWFDHMYGVNTITNIGNLNTSQVTDMSYMFFCSRQTSLDLTHFNTANVTNMGEMFYGCSELTALDLSHFDTANVTNMGYMFSGCSALTNLSLNFNTSKVTDMNHMFYGCKKLQTISFGSNWSTANVTDMSYMFAECNKLLSLNLNSWNVGKAANMSYMFNECESLNNLNVNNWNTSSVTNISEMFSGCSMLTTLNLSGWNTSSVTDMRGLFYGCELLETISFGSNWDTGNVTSMFNMFHNCQSLKSSSLGSLSSWNTSQVASMSNMFSGCTQLASINLTGWDTGKVTSMFNMFSDCSQLASINLTGWNTGNVTDMSYMFCKCSSLTTLTGINNLNTESLARVSGMFADCSSLLAINLNAWNTGSLTNMSTMFRSCSKLTSLDLSNWNNQELTDITDMFKDCPSLATVNLSGWKTPKLTSIAKWFQDCPALANLDLTNFDGPVIEDMSYLFYGCSSLAAVDLSTLNTPYVTNMSSMFSGCTQLASINLTGWNTGNVTNMFRLFYGCSSLTALDLSTLNTSSVTNMVLMFGNCAVLSSLNISNWNTSQVTSMSSMFSGCTQLASVNLTGWDTGNVKSMSSMFNGCPMLSVIDLSAWNTCNVTNMSDMFRDCLNLTTIYVGNEWTTTKVKEASGMFKNCTNLVGGMGTTYNPSLTDAFYARIDGGAGDRGYLSSMPYVVYADGTLTFYGDGNRDAHADETIYYLNSDIEPPTWLEQKANVTTVVFDPSFANIRPTSANSWFREMTKLTEITGLEYLHTDYVTTMIFMFYHCTSLRNLDVSNFNTANVKNMQGMFDLCSNLTQLDLSSFNTAKVTDMSNMFYRCNKLTTISVGQGWNTDSLTNSVGMFEGCTVLVGGNGTAYSAAHKDGAYARIDLPENPGYFCDQTLKGIYVAFDPETGTLSFRNDTRRDSFGDNAFDLNQDEENPGWYANRKAVTNVVFDFTFADVHPTTAYSWFRGMSNLTDISGMEYLHTDDVTNMESMFSGCSKLTDLNLSSFNTAAVLNMENMFNGCTHLTTINVGTGWNTDNVINSIDMFDGCTALVGGNGTTYDETHTDKEYARLNGGTSIPSYLTDNLPLEPYVVFADGTLTFRYDGLKSLQTDSYDLNPGDDTPAWLSHNSAVTAVVFEPSFAEARPTSTHSWFDSMNQLADISGMEYLNTSEVSDMASMFNACTGLTTLDLGSFNTANVQNMSAMFSGCSALTTIYAGTGWSTASVTQSDGMFAGCTQLAGAAGTQFSPDATGEERACVDGVDERAGYFSYLAYATIRHAYGADGIVYNYLTFFYDGMHAQHALTEPVYRLNTGTEEPEWLARAADFNTVLFDRSFQNVRPTSTYHWFRGMTALTRFTGEGLNTSEVTTMSGMFEGCTALTACSPKGWDTSKVTDMSSMFKECTALFDADFSSFNTAHVATMSGMFQGCTALTTLSLNAFSTGSVTDMNQMFQGCTALQTISVSDSWATNNVTSSSDMFLGCSNLKGSEGTTYNASYTDKNRARVDGGTSSPGYLSYLTAEAYAAFDPATGTLTFYHDRWRSTRGDAENTFPITDERNWRKTNIVHVVFDPSFDDVRPTTTAQWFFNRYKLEDISGMEYLHTDDVTSMESMFNGCSELTSLDLTHFNTANVTNMSHMFYNCPALTSLDLSTWDTGNVTNMDWMFRLCTSLETIFVDDGWNTDKVTSSSMMFYDCTNLHGSSYTRYNSSNPADKTYARVDQGTSQPGYLSLKAKAYAYVADGTLFFCYDAYFKQHGQTSTIYDVSEAGTTPPGWVAQSAEITRVYFNYQFANVHPTSTRMWFANMTNLSDIRGIDEYLSTDSVTDMSQMFQGCTSLAELNLISFDTQQVTDMSQMFAGCTALRELDLSSFSVQRVANMTGIFQGCSNLQTINVRSDWNPAGVLSGTSANMFDGCTALVGGNGTAYDAAHKDKEYARIDSPSTGSPGYLTRAQRAYAAFVGGDSLVFYCDDQRSLREGMTFSLNTDDEEPEWHGCSTVSHVVFDPTFDAARPTSTAYWFFFMENLEDIEGMEYLHTDNVTFMTSMFGWCSSLKSIDVNHWDTRNVTSMGRMFYGCQHLETLDAAAWNTQSLTDTWQMFGNCTSLTELDLSGWNTSKVTNMYGMFDNCSALETIYAANWNKEDITQHDTFRGCTKLVGGAGTAYTGYESATAGYDHLDGGTSSPGFFTDPTQREAYAYYSAADSTLTFCYDAKRSARQSEGKTVYTNVLNTGSNPPQWRTISEGIAHVEFNSAFANARPKSTREWFSTMKNLTGISGMEYLRTDEVTNMSYMFFNCTVLESLDVTHFNTANVTNMGYMFSNCIGLTSLDLSHFNTEKVTNMSSMFDRCSALTALDVSGFNTASVTSMYAMFSGCQALTTLDVSGFNTASVTNMNSMFSGCQVLTTLDVSGFNTARVTTMYSMFSGCRALTTLDVSGFNTASANMYAMFNNCIGLTSLDLSHFNTEKVMDMRYMFSNCTVLESLDLTHFNTANVTNMGYMFYGCSALTALDLSHFNTANVTNMGYMFSNCIGLTSLDLTHFNTAQHVRYVQQLHWIDKSRPEPLQYGEGDGHEIYVLRLLRTYRPRPEQLQYGERDEHGIYVLRLLRTYRPRPEPLQYSERDGHEIYVQKLL